MTEEIYGVESNSIGNVVMSTFASPHFDEYRKGHPARESNPRTGEPADALENKSPHPEISSLTEAPTTVTVSGSWTDEATKHLWLIGTDDVRVALEHGELGKSCGRGKLAHTNLFGNIPAHSGGELWFRGSEHIWLNGGSGRYPARSPEELEASVDGFREAGYKVCCFGWDNVRKAPARVLLEGAEGWK